MDSFLEFRPRIESNPPRLPPVALMSFALLLTALLIVARGISDVSLGLETFLLAAMAIGGSVMLGTQAGIRKDPNSSGPDKESAKTIASAGLGILVTGVVAAIVGGGIMMFSGGDDSSP